jgi:putative membrane protein
MALMAMLDRLPRKVATDTVPQVLLAWVYVSNVVGNLVFFGRPGVAVWGGICMGVIVIPWVWRVWSQPQW